MEILPKSSRRKGIESDGEDSGGEGFFDRLDENRNFQVRRSTYHNKTGIVAKDKGDEKKKAVVRDPNFKYVQSVSVVPKKEQQNFMRRKDFSEFIDNTTRLVERSLNQEFDLLGNFFLDNDEEAKDENKAQRGEKVKYHFTYQQEEPIRRAITSVDWSPHPAHNGELFLASMSRCSENRPNEPDGRIDIYSLSLRTRPDRTLTCQYEVTKAIFHPHDKKWVIGATQCGYLLMWDLEEKHEMPRYKSVLADHGHQYPVFSLALVGPENSSTMTSISNDGWVCQWKKNHLATPHKYFYLEIPESMRVNSDNVSSSTLVSAQQDMSKNNVHATCIDFPDGEADHFLVGSEDYNVYQGLLHPTEGGNNVERVFKSHQGPVTQVDVHPGLSQNDRYSEMSELFLTSSFDWTVKLWDRRLEQPVKTFESSQEYVFDVQWSPTHPSVFASIDADGFLDVWDINKETVKPIIHKKIEREKRSFPLNVLRWSRDGRRIAVGDSEGFLSIMNVDSELAVPKQEDFDQIMRNYVSGGMKDDD